MLGQTNLYVNRSCNRTDKLLHCLYVTRHNMRYLQRRIHPPFVRDTYAEYTRIFFRQINRHDDFYTRVIRILFVDKRTSSFLVGNQHFFFFSFFFVLLPSSSVGKFVHICFDNLTKDHFYWRVTYCPNIYKYMYIGMGTKKMKLCIPRIEELRERNGLPRIN